MLSHIDECEQEELQECLEAVGKVAPDVSVFCMPWDHLPAKELVKLAKKQQKPVGEKKFVKEFAPKVTLGGVLKQPIVSEKSQFFSSVTIFTDHMFSKEELKTCLKECREKVKEYGRVLRVKGNVRDAEGYLSFESITGRDYIEESLEKETAIVVIGQNLQKERLFGLFTGKSVG